MADRVRQPRALRIFLSYAHDDVDFQRALDRHLAPLKRSGTVEVWSDRAIAAGSEWDEAIRRELAAADIVVLLVSAHFNASEYIFEHELREALRRHDEGTARVVPVIIRPCAWERMTYARLQALPPLGRPVSEYPDRDRAYVEIVEGLDRVIADLTSRSPAP